MRVLLGDILLGIEQQHHHVGVRDRLQRLDHRELLDRFEHLAALAQASRVNQRVRLAATLELHIDGVARGTRHVEGNHTLFADQGVHERGLANVRATNNGDLDAVLAGILLICQFRTLLNGQVKGFIDQLAHAVAMRRRDRVRVTHAQFIEIRSHRGVLHALGLVDRQHHAATCLAEVIRDDTVLRRQPQATIDEEDDDIRFHHGLARLLGHFGNDAFLGHRLEASGIDHDEGAIADTALAVMAVPCQARQIGDERVARAGHAIE